MTLTVDLTGVEAWKGGSILPPGGPYTMVVEDASESTSTSGNPQLKLEMRCTTGPQEGDSITDWATITTKSLGRIKQMLEAFGMPSDGPLTINPKTFVGRLVQIIVRDEPGEDGKTHTKVKAYMSAGTATAASPAAATSADDKLPF